MRDETTLKEDEIEKNEKTLNKVLSGKRRGLRFVGVFLQAEIFEELEKIAREEERTISQLVGLAVRKYLERRKNAEVEK